VRKFERKQKCNCAKKKSLKYPEKITIKNKNTRKLNTRKITIFLIKALATEDTFSITNTCIIFF